MEDVQIVAIWGTIAGVILSYILTAVAGWQILKKAGIKEQKALIPFYNIFLLYKLSGVEQWFWTMMISICCYLTACFANDYNPYSLNPTFDHMTTLNLILFCLLMVVSSVGMLAAEIMLAIRLAKKFGKGNGFAVGLFFLPHIFQLILGFGKAKYQKKNSTK